MTLLQPGDHVEVRICKVRHLPSKDAKPGKVLAVVGMLALVEYDHGHHTALTFIPANRQPGAYEPAKRNALGYRGLPQKWLKAIVSSGQSWHGKSLAGQVPPPVVLLQHLH